MEAVENALKDFYNGGSVPDNVIEDAKKVNENTKEKKESVSVEEYESLKKELNDMKSKYGASSAGAKRLDEKLKSLEPYLPILDLLKNDEGATRAIANYIDGNTSVQSSVKAELGLGEDFVYSEQDAINEPDSDSAKVMKRMMERVANEQSIKVKQELESKLEAEKRNLALKSQVNDLKLKYNLSDEQLNEFLTEMNSHQLTLEELFVAMNKDKMQETLVNNIVKEKLGANGKTNMSLASTGGNEKSVESSIMDAIVGARSGGSSNGALADFLKI